VDRASPIAEASSSGRETIESARWCVCVGATDGRKSDGSALLAVSNVVLRPRAQVKGIRPESELVWIGVAAVVPLARQRGAHSDGNIDVPRQHVAARVACLPVPLRDELALRKVSGSTIWFAGWLAPGIGPRVKVNEATREPGCRAGTRWFRGLRFVVTWPGDCKQLRSPPVIDPHRPSCGWSLGAGSRAVTVVRRRHRPWFGIVHGSRLSRSNKGSVAVGSAGTDPRRQRRGWGFIRSRHGQAIALGTTVAEALRR
jgi:hypothetical protein